MSIGIAAIGIANPVFKCSQEEAADVIANVLQLSPAEKRLLRSIYKATGIKQRHSVIGDYCKPYGQYEFFPNHPSEPAPSTADRMKVYKDNALTLALSAINNCVQGRDIDCSTITHVITVSCTGMYAPGLDIEITQQLKLSSSTKRTAINFMGCYGAFNAIKVADAICKADQTAKVLIVSVELCSIHLQNKKDMDNLVANAIFSDGAAAALIQANPTTSTNLRFSSFHCDLVPQSGDAMAWQIADNGFDIVLSSYVPEAIESGIGSFMTKLISQSNITFEDIDFFAIHPGGRKILEACEQTLGISKDHNKYAYQVLRDYGNMSSATILFVLKLIMDNLQHQDHRKHIFSCAFGPGLTLESMLLQVHCG